VTARRTVLPRAARDPDQTSRSVMSSQRWVNGTTYLSQLGNIVRVG